MSVEVVDRHGRHRAHAATLRRFASSLSRELRRPADETVTICLVGDALMRRLNLEWRDRDRSTDVLSFEGGGVPAPEGTRHLGDVVISIPAARRQARAAGHTVARELRLLLLHGYLHLLGHDHATDDGRMMRLQRRLETRLLPGRGARG